MPRSPISSWPTWPTPPPPTRRASARPPVTAESPEGHQIDDRSGSGVITKIGAILAGGSSSRMGTDKALVEVDGRPMALHVADALRAGGAEVVVLVGADRVVGSQLDL